MAEMPYITNHFLCTAFTLAKFCAAEIREVCSTPNVRRRHRNFALLRHQQGLSSLVSVGWLETFLTYPESTGRYQGRVS
jgi:hypothetical protein